MKARSEAEPWVQNLRGFLRDSVGTQWQVRNIRGMAYLAVRFEDKKRVERNLGLNWSRGNAAKIRDAVEEIFDLVVRKHIGLNEALLRVKTTKSDKPKAVRRANPKLLLSAWEQYESYKVKVAGDVTQDTWDKEYGKTFRRLKEVAAANVNDLLIEVGKKYEPGTRSRQIRVQHVAAFLRWAVSKQSGYLLPEDAWTPPPKNALGDYVGRKSKEKQAQSSAPTVVIEDKDLLELVDSLPIDLDTYEKKHRLRERAMEWDLAIKLAITYGLRPIEVSYDYLEVRKNGKEYMFCTYAKRAGAGTTKPRRLFPLHPEWEVNWSLIKRLKRKDPLPKMTSGAGDSFKNYLRFNKVWKRLKEQNKVVVYSFRHSYAKRGHQVYKLSDTEMAAMMGHTTQVHNQAYAQWSSESMLEDSMKRAIKFRDLTN